ncbi:MAG: hypothetical protein ACI4SO_07220 [Muribaculaceae bacterium]
MELKDRITAVLTYAELSASAFAKKIGVKTTQAIYDLVSGKTKTLSSDILNKVLSCYPDLSLEWLVRGEGEMLKPVQQISYGDRSPNLNGKGNSVNFGTEDLKLFIEELSAQRRISERTLSLLEKRDDQIDRLISIIEKQK